jgi:hypothetical protein
MTNVVYNQKMGVFVGRVDCTVNRLIAKRLAITRFPTLILYACTIHTHTHTHTHTHQASDATFDTDWRVRILNCSFHNGELIAHHNAERDVDSLVKFVERSLANVTSSAPTPAPANNA